MHAKILRRRLVRVGLYVGLAIIAAWIVDRVLAPAPGSSADVFARLRIGMSQDEAIAVLRSYGPHAVEAWYASGTTTAGQDFSSVLLHRFLEDLPASHAIANCVIDVSADHDIQVTLGPGGIVAGKAITPGVWEHRLKSVEGRLRHAAEDITSGSWWRRLLWKFDRAMTRRWPHVLLGGMTVTLLLSAWLMRWRLVVLARRLQTTMSVKFREEPWPR